MNTEQQETTNEARSQRPEGEEFKHFITQHWAEAGDSGVSRMASASFAAERRANISALFPGERLVFPAGELKTRSNDTDYRFRPESNFAYLTGLGVDREPSAVLVMEPTEHGHDAVLYIVPPAGRDSEGFYSDSRSGEFWIGKRPGIAEFSELTGLEVRSRKELPEGIRLSNYPTAKVAQVLSEMRMIKDDYEIQQLREAVAATISGFHRVVKELPRALSHKRGERVVEATFDGHAREEGNGVGYETIAAAGPHATTLHWIDNTGQLVDGDLLLLDAGVEVESLYTADITRTLPISGTFSDAQRKVYDVVLEAADAGFAVAKPGYTFRDVHNAAMAVIERRLNEWGIVPPSEAENAGLYRRWMVHSTSHHLGLDVHDCAQAKRELYLDGELEAGMVITIEPGLYFQPDDLAAPAELRGIGIRIEDDVLITEDSCENLSAALPRDPVEVEQWMKTIAESA